MDSTLADRAVIEQQLLDLFASEGKVDRSAMKPEATLESLGIQSVDIVMVLMSVDEKYGVYVPIDEKLSETKNLQGFIDHLTNRIIEQQKSRAK
jgi:acyl carrier protein